MKRWILLGVWTLCFASGAFAGRLTVVNTVTIADGQSAPALDLYVDGFPLVSNLRYAQVVELANAPAGTRTFSVRSRVSGRVITEQQFNFSAASVTGQFLAIAGDGNRQRHALLTWSQLPIPAAAPAGLVRIFPAYVHLAPTLSTRLELTRRITIGVVSQPATALAFEYGVYPNISSSISSGGPVIVEVGAIDPDRGLIASRLPAFDEGAHNITSLLIGNGAQSTPLEWLHLDGSVVYSRGAGSYATHPVFAGRRYFAMVGQPGSGLTLETLGEGARLVGFMTGIGTDFRSTWQLLDGPRIAPSEYRLQAVTGSPNGDIGEVWQLKFLSCNDVEFKHFRDNRLIREGLLRRGSLGEACFEYRPS